MIVILPMFLIQIYLCLALAVGIIQEEQTLSTQWINPVYPIFTVVADSEHGSLNT